MVTVTGNWVSVNITGSSTMLGKSYLSDGDAGKGSKSVLFQVSVPFAGWYAVSFTYDAGYYRAIRVPVTVTDANGPRLVYVNERVQVGAAFPLGIFQFNTNGTVLVENKGTNLNQTDLNGNVCVCVMLQKY